jgi:hypothetical protein
MGNSGRPSRQVCRRLAVLVPIAFACLPASAALASLRYAAPTDLGTANCESEANACTAEQAISGSSSKDTVVLLGDHGSYGSLASPLTKTLKGPKADAPATIEGAAGQPRPVIYTSAEPGLEFFEATLVEGVQHATSLSDLEVQETASGLPIALATVGDVDRIVARTLHGGDACAFYGLEHGQQEASDSLCVGTGFGGSGLGIVVTGTGQTDSVVLRNDTFYGSGEGSTRGIDIGVNDLTLDITAFNVISYGETESVAANGQAHIVFHSSNYDAPLQLNGAATATAPGTDGNQTAAPLFVNAPAGDFEEAPGSPTIDAGATEAANGETDLAGRPRTIGPATDIGAYEAPDPPTLTAGAVSSLSTTTATLNATVNPNYEGTTVQAFIGTSTATETPVGVPRELPAGLTPVALSFPAGSLAPGTLYHFHFTAKNGRGEVSSPDMTLTTAAATGPGPGSLKPPPGKLTLHVSRALVHGADAAVELSCSAASLGCRGELLLTRRVKLTTVRHGRRRTVTVTRVLARAAYSLSAGQTLSVLVPLNRHTRHELSSAPHHRLSLVAEATRSDGGAPARGVIVLVRR